MNVIIKDDIRINSTAKYIDPEDVTLSPGGNVPKSETVNDQTLNAIDAAEDQQTGRVNQQLQRNEDLDQSQIAVMEEIAEDQDLRFGQGLESGEIAPGKEYKAPIDTVTQSLPDGPPPHGLLPPPEPQGLFLSFQFI